jgi:hypothetical protein
MHARLRSDGSAIVTLSVSELRLMERALACGQLACKDVSNGANPAGNFAIERLQVRRAEARNAAELLGKLSSVIAAASR